MNRTAPSSWRLQKHVSLPSTQDVAVEAANTGDVGRLAVMADEQVAGRGSRGRRWVAPAGNLNLSVLFRLSRANANPGYWSRLAGLALYEALAPFCDGLMLKWPNDLMLDGRKVGGILIDSALDADGLLNWVVIGFGANLREAPYVPGRETACLPAPAPSAHDTAITVLDGLDRWMHADVQSAWLARAHAPGTSINVLAPERTVQGRFAGLTEQGELLLQGEPSPVSSAEIFLQRPDTGMAKQEPAVAQPCSPPCS